MKTDIQPRTALAPPRTRARHSRTWFWPGIGIATVGLVAGLAIGITNYQDSQKEINTFARTSVPGTATVRVDEPGQLVVYYEGEENVRIDELAVGVLDPAGETVPVFSYEGELIYETTDLILGRAIASFEASQIGAYEVEVSGLDTGQITVGESYSRLALPGVFVGLVIGGLSLLVGFVLLVFRIVGR